MNALLIVNPRAGKVKRKMPPLLKWTFKKLKKRLRRVVDSKSTVQDVIREVKKRCHKEKIKLDIQITKYPGHALELAKNAKNKYDLVIAAGGDGTLNEVINGLHDSRTTLVIIPFGTANVLAVELGIPFELKLATALITQGKKIRIDLGYAKTDSVARYFAICLGVGFDASLIKQIDSKFKKKWGKMAYFLGGIKHLFVYEWPYIYVDHTTHSMGYFVLIANSKYYGGEYQIANKAKVDDGLLDLVIINRQKWWNIVKIIFSSSSGKSNTFLQGEYSTTKKAHIYSHEKMFVEADGELIGQAPVDVTIFPKSLRVMVNK